MNKEQEKIHICNRCNNWDKHTGLCEPWEQETSPTVECEEFEEIERNENDM